MAFTGQLGTPNSALGSIKLGAISSVSHDLTLTVGCSANLTILDGGTLYRSQSVDGISAVTLASQYNTYPTLTVTTIGDISFHIPILLTLSVSGISAFTMLPGQQYFVFAAIEGLSDLAITPGKGYFDTVDTAVSCNLTIDNEAFTLLTLTIDGFAAADTATLQNGRIALTVAGFAALTVNPNFTYQLTFSMPGIATIYEGSELNGGGTDGLHNFMALTSNDTVDVAPFRQTPGNQNPSSQGDVTVSCTGVFNRTVLQNLVFAQSAICKKPTEVNQMFIILSQTATCQRVRNQTVTQTLSMTQDAQAYRAFLQSLVFTHDATVTRVRFFNVTQTLALVQTLERNLVLNRTIIDTLTMGQTRLVRPPLIGTINTSNPTPFEYYQPAAQAILVPNRCLVILGVPSQTVILPCPQFGDTQARSSTINLKRTMTGDTYTYVRKTELQKLKYTFQVGTYKAIELQSFLENHCHEIITLVNHKGETWYVNLANNPFEFSVAERWQHKGERHDITLEFEGVQQ